MVLNKILLIKFEVCKYFKALMVDRVGNAPTTSRMSSEHSTFELTVQKFF